MLRKSGTNGSKSTSPDTTALTCSPAVGAGAEVDYTGIDDYNSVNGSEDEEEEVDRELEEVDVSDLQVEEVC